MSGASRSTLASSRPSKGGCVYFLQPTIFGSYYYGAVDTTIVHVADNVVVEFAGGYDGSLEGFFRPFTLAQVITDYCKSIHYSKLYEMMMLSMWGIWDKSYDDSESDESSSSELDDEESSSSEHDDDEASSSEPADD